MDVIDDGLVDLVINVARTYDELGRPDGYLIRRRAVDAEVPLVTDLMLAKALVNALRNRGERPLPIHAWNEYLERQPRFLEDLSPAVAEEAVDKKVQQIAAE